MRKRSAVPVVPPLLVMTLVFSLGAKRPKNGGGDKPEQQQTTDPPPAPVVATVRERLPGATITGYEHETDDKRQLFFVDVTTTDSQKVTLLVSRRGQYLGQVIDNDDDDDGDVFIDLATAPDGVKKGIARYYKVEDASKAQLDNLFMEVEESRFIFVTERTRKNITEWVSLALNGNIVSVETETDLKDVPSPVKEAVTKAHPNGKLTGAAITEEREKKTTYYTIEVTDGKKLEVTVSPEGKIQATEDAEEDATKPG